MDKKRTVTMPNRYETADVWTQKARKAGYPARSVYKLEEILKKFPLLPKFPLPPVAKNAPPAHQAPQPSTALLDLGAAPGSWSLYLLRNLTGGFRLAACDLLPLSREFDGGLFDNDNFVFLRGDMYSPEIREKIAALGPYNLIVCDAAPATSGSRSLDSVRSVELAENALMYAGRTLTEGGGLVVKVFQGPDSAAFLKKMRTVFSTVKPFKPAACRPNSVETYFIGLGKRRLH
ncbi:MAG: RlmE family RNA methyltransferase [Spirochaetaceae bacterium]|jgi:23S rRNA (uridine2552-2'-O)-methyltransferase|nr:RlmE family RNA methyltransferase [Spirochaetaceae bacterium]